MQQAVSVLRRALAGAGADPTLIATCPPGYLLATDQQNLDTARFFALVGLARQHTPGGATSEAGAIYRDALALWRGSACDGIVAAALEVEAARLEEVRLTVVEECAEAELASGGHTDLVAELTSWSRGARLGPALSR
jgi:DNA-binding SARP family transcriptional activator